MIDLLLKAIDRIVDLLRMREKRFLKRFEQLWKPTYNDLQSVHADYWSMFQKVHSLLSQGIKEEQEGQPSDCWQRAIEFVKQQRVALAPVRQKLTALGQLATDEALLDELKEEERKYFSEVTAYIGVRSLPDVVGTRSADLQAELERMARMDRTVAERIVFEELDRRIEQLGEDWIDVSKAFNALQVALIRQSI